MRRRRRALADVIRRDLRDKSKPYVAAGFAATRALTRDGAFADQELVKALDAVFADGAAGAAVRVKAFARDLWAGGRPALARGDILVEGNWDAGEARAIAAAVASALPLRPGRTKLPDAEGLALDRPTVPITQVLRIGAEEIGTEERNSAAELLSVGSGPRAVALASVLSALLKPIFFDALRTKEQLGYVVQLGQRALPGAARNIALVLLVQGEKPPTVLTHRLRKFVTTEAAAAVRNLDEKTLRGIASSLADQKLRTRPAPLRPRGPPLGRNPPDARFCDRGRRRSSELEPALPDGGRLERADAVRRPRPLGGRRVGRQLRGRGFQRAGRRFNGRAGVRRRCAARCSSPAASV